MNAMMMYALQILLDAHDPDAPIPDPAEGETVIAYWTRVIKYQAYERGYTMGNADGSITLWDYDNPHDRPIP